jgi:hypothetical protein
MSAVREAVAGRAGLREADFQGCRWIEGPPTPLRSGMFCCAPTAPGSSWCPRHRQIVWAAHRRRTLVTPRQVPAAVEPAKVAK